LLRMDFEQKLAKSAFKRQMRYLWVLIEQFIDWSKEGLEYIVGLGYRFKDVIFHLN
jgi:hypothetical protein